MRTINRHSTALVAAAAMAFVAMLWYGVRERDDVVGFDQDANRWFATRRTTGVVSVMQAMTRLADVRVVCVVVAGAAVLLLLRREPRAAVFVVVSSAGTSIVVAIMKLVVGRPRPAVGATIAANGYAFPSGHAAQSIACYGALAIVAWSMTGTRRGRFVAMVAAVFFALAIGTSRLVLGVHWVSDVVAGWSVAIGWVSVTMLITGPSAAPGRIVPATPSMPLRR